MLTIWIKKKGKVRLTCIFDLDASNETIPEGQYPFNYTIQIGDEKVDLSGQEFWELTNLAQDMAGALAHFANQFKSGLDNLN